MVNMVAVNQHSIDGFDSPATDGQSLLDLAAGDPGVEQ